MDKRDLEGPNINNIDEDIADPNYPEKTPGQHVAPGTPISEVAPPTGTRPSDTPQGPYPTSTPQLDMQEALLANNEVESLRMRWNEIQGKFVDEPRSAVQQADALVTDVIQKVTQIFTDEHSKLEGQWKQGSDVSTEDLRQALQHYRTFFNRLIT
jgi:hypothetical protein